MDSKGVVGDKAVGLIGGGGSSDRSVLRHPTGRCRKVGTAEKRADLIGTRTQYPRVAGKITAVL